MPFKPSHVKGPDTPKETPAWSRLSDAVLNDLEERHTSLTRRLAAKQEEKSKYVKLYAQGHLDEEELEVHMADLKNQVENLKLLASSVESDMATRDENRMVARTIEAWLLTLRKNLAEVERNTEEAFEIRCELARLLVEQIIVAATRRAGPRWTSPTASGRRRLRWWRIVRTVYQIPRSSHECTGGAERAGCCAGTRR